MFTGNRFDFSRYEANEFCIELKNIDKMRQKIMFNVNKKI